MNGFCCVHLCGVSGDTIFCVWFSGFASFIWKTWVPPTYKVKHPTTRNTANFSSGLLVPAHNLLQQVVTLWTSKVEVSKTSFFGIMDSPNDAPSYVRHFLGSGYVSFTLFGYFGGGGGGVPPNGLVQDLLEQLSHRVELKNRTLLNVVFLFRGHSK